MYRLRALTAPFLLAVTRTTGGSASSGSSRILVRHTLFRLASFAAASPLPRSITRAVQSLSQQSHCDSHRAQRALSVAAQPPPPPVDARVTECDYESFAQLVQNNAMITVVEFYSAKAQSTLYSDTVLLPLTADPRFNGKVQLARMDIDKHTAVASRLNIQNVPTLYSFCAGRLIQSVAGELTSDELTRFVSHALQALLPLSAEVLLKQANGMLATMRLDEARALLTPMLTDEQHSASSRAAVTAAIVRCEALCGELATAEQHLNRLQTDFASLLSDPAVTQSQTLFQLMHEHRSNATADLAKLRVAAQSSKADLDTKFNFASAAIAQRHFIDASNELLRIARAQRDWQGGKAVRTLQQLYMGLGPEHEVTRLGVKRLANVLT